MFIHYKLVTFLYALAIAPIIIGGMVYASLNEFMPYHSDAVEQSWQSLSNGLQVLILACLNAAGGIMALLGILLMWILLKPFQQGQRWALIGIPTVGIAVMTVGMKSALMVNTLTPANPPWFIFLIVIAVFIVAASVSAVNVMQDNAGADAV